MTLPDLSVSDVAAGLGFHTDAIYEGRDTKPCESCGHLFERRRRYGPKRWAMARFCSRRCATIAHSSPVPVHERILARCVPEGDCIVFTGYRDERGYGKAAGNRVDGSARCISVHRAVYEALVGPIPEGLTLDHLCCNKPCVNPSHLEPVTSAENKKRDGDRMTACRRGHPRTPENLYVAPTGKRVCRVCRRKGGKA